MSKQTNHSAFWLAASISILMAWVSTAQATPCGVGSSGGRPIAADKVAVKWDTFRSQGMGISVDYPVNASFTEPRINSIQIACEARSQPAADDPHRLVYRIRSYERPTGQSLQEFARHRYQEDIQGGRLVEDLIDTTVGGKDAYRYVIGNGKTDVHVIFSNGAEGAILVRYTKPGADQELLQRIVERMSQSLVLLAQAGPEPGSTGEPTRFTLRLAEGYANQMQKHPEAFSWDELARSLRIQVQPSDHWNRSGGNRQVRLEAVAVRSDSVVAQACGDGFPVVADGTPLNDQGLPVDQTEAGGRIPGEPGDLGPDLRQLARQVALELEEGDRFYAPFSGDAANPQRDDDLARPARGRNALILYLDYVDPASSWAAVTEPLVLLTPGLADNNKTAE